MSLTRRLLASYLVIVAPSSPSVSRCVSRPALDTRGRDEVGQLVRALRTVDENLSGRLDDLERERAGMAALIGSMVEVVVACNARGEVTSLNPAARELLGHRGPDPPDTRYGGHRCFLAPAGPRP